MTVGDATRVIAARPSPRPPAPPPAPFDDATELVGNTPLLRVRSVLDRAGATGAFWAKLEGRNPGGLKARAALGMIIGAERRGVLRPGGTIIESTSGTLGLALAFVGVTRGYRVILVGDPGLEPMVRTMLAAHGVDVDLVVEPDPVGGWQEARRRRVAARCEQHPSAFWPDQYDNPDNPDGYAGLAAELVAQLERLDVLVCSVGTGGHSRGLSARLRQRWPGLRLVGVDSVRSTLFGQPAGVRLMRGLGSSFHPGNVDHDAFDEVHWVTAAESVWACRTLARRSWVTGGWSTGAVALVASWIAEQARPTAAPGTPVVAAVFPDGPERYWDTVFDDAFCARHDLTDVPAPRGPQTVHDIGERVVQRWTRTTTVPDGPR